MHAAASHGLPISNYSYRPKVAFNVARAMKVLYTDAVCGSRNHSHVKFGGTNLNRPVVSREHFCRRCRPIAHTNCFIKSQDCDKPPNTTGLQKAR